jgi:hypothetical protein
VSALGKIFLEKLTISDVRQLAGFEMPEISNSVKLGKSGDTDVDLTPGSLPRNLYMATLSAQLLLFFVIMYFGAFSGEAISSGGFPITGTLFSAFAQSFWTLLVFFIALWVPVLSSLVVLAAAWQTTTLSRRLPLILCSVLTGLAVFSVQATLQRKDYFHALRLTGSAQSQPRATLPFSNAEKTNQVPGSLAATKDRNAKE